MPKITSINNFLSQTVYHDGNKYCINIVDLSPQKQRGQTCKLYALSTAINAMSIKLQLPKPLNVRGHSSGESSIRKIAKERYGSVVGEVYSPVTLRFLAKDLGYSKTSIYSPRTFDDYNHTIITSLSILETPIVFFDVCNQGEPIQANGEREHAVVICGYFYNLQKELCYLFTQWGEFYWANSIDIFRSSIQLQEHRTPESFYKFSGEWVDHTMLQSLPKAMIEKGFEDYRKARATHPIEGSCRNKILVVHNPFIKENRNSFWNSYRKETNEEFGKMFAHDVKRYTQNT